MKRRNTFTNFYIGDGDDDYHTHLICDCPSMINDASHGFVREIENVGPGSGRSIFRKMEVQFTVRGRFRSFSFFLSCSVQFKVTSILQPTTR